MPASSRTSTPVWKKVREVKTGKAVNSVHTLGTGDQQARDRELGDLELLEAELPPGELRHPDLGGDEVDALRLHLTVEDRVRAGIAPDRKAQLEVGHLSSLAGSRRVALGARPERAAGRELVLPDRLDDLFGRVPPRHADGDQRLRGADPSGDLGVAAGRHPPRLDVVGGREQEPPTGLDGTVGRTECLPRAVDDRTATECRLQGEVLGVDSSDPGEGPRALHLAVDAVVVGLVRLEPPGTGDVVLGAAPRSVLTAVELLCGEADRLVDGVLPVVDAGVLVVDRYPEVAVDRRAAVALPRRPRRRSGSSGASAGWASRTGRRGRTAGRRQRCGSPP